MQEVDSLARWLVEDPTAAPLLAGALVAVVVQGLRRIWPGVAGAERWRNLAIAAATSFAVTWARQQLSAEHEPISQLMVGTFVTWASAALTHNIALRRNGAASAGAVVGTQAGGQ